MSFHCYMLHCNGGYFYVGHTDDIDVRIWQHENGALPGFTKDHLPVKLVWAEEFPTRDEAKVCEARIKGWSRAKKMALIRGDWSEISALAKKKGNPSAFGRSLSRAPALRAVEGTSSGQTDFE